MEPEQVNQDPVIEAAWRVLSEIASIFRPLGNRAVLVGGWIPYLLYGSHHIGSTDVDLALDISQITPPETETILTSLIHCGYRRSPDRAFTWIRDVDSSRGERIAVEVDFLSPEGMAAPPGSIETFGARGCDLALRDNRAMSFAGRFPDGRAGQVDLVMATEAAFIVTKAMALMGRTEPKDAYDIYFCVRHHPHGAEAFGASFEKILENTAILEALAKIRYVFRSVNSEGPSDVVTVLNPGDSDERNRLKRDAFEQLSTFLDSAGIP